ncbi:uncharacterized protein EV154DRAFT_70479 [Mucor mucedo]|uniref:uncharacterized protein n=1 Tax=Mucor mucedo TaxID=29922 RepID=UPI00221EFAA0|nr:uncharacterized protein EV154DRAFT_70479 [Mucor mucedo]KAI7894712.1 hypothetical protein EV154DRAFT_70479 [Mucor mucedo]
MDMPKANVFDLLDIDKNPIKISFSDLNRVLYRPFIKHITQKIVDSFSCIDDRKLLLSGEYCCDTYFVECLLYNNNAMCLKYAAQLYKNDMVGPYGAVSSAMRFHQDQIPFSIDGATAIDEKINVIKEESTIDQDFDFLIGIDFGSTFTGCSYVNLKNGGETVKTIKSNNWPGGGGLNLLDKTQTLLMVNSKTNHVSWGGAVNHEMGYDSYTEVFDNLKENLNHPELMTEGEMNPTAYYLMYLNDHIMEYIIGNEIPHTQQQQDYKFKYIMTVPVKWNDNCRTNLVEAAITALMIKEDETDRLTLIDEPDAAMVFSRNMLHNRFGNYGNEGKKFVLCDAGGLNVNAFTYHWQNQEEGSQFLQILESNSDTCGSKSLNIKFRDYLWEFYQDCGVYIGEIEMALNETVDYFEKEYKPNIMPYANDNDYHDFDLTDKNSVSVKEGATKYKLVNNNRTLRISNGEIKTKIVDPIVDRVLSILKKQYVLTDDAGMRIDAIIMVGGFSRSTYLQRRIKDEYRGVCNVIFPDDAINVFSVGAVKYAMNPYDIPTKYKGPSISLEIQCPLNQHNSYQSSSLKVKGSDGRYYLRNRLQYFVRKGQKLSGRGPYYFSQVIRIPYPTSAVIGNICDVFFFL